MFSEFIEPERNNVLKTYELGAVQNVSITLRPQFISVGRHARHSMGRRPMAVYTYAAPEVFADRSPSELIAKPSSSGAIIWMPWASRCGLARSPLIVCPVPVGTRHNGIWLPWGSATCRTFLSLL